MDRTQLISNVRSNLAGLGRGNLGVPLLLLAMLGMMTLPIPPFLLDVLFTFNIALSIVVLLVCVYALRPLDFATELNVQPFWAKTVAEYFAICRSLGSANRVSDVVVLCVP